MHLIQGIQASIIVILLAFITIPALSFASGENTINGSVASQVFEKAKTNDNLKLAFVTGKDAQVVLRKFNVI